MKSHPLKVARELYCWSQARLAKELGVSVRTVSRWEQGLVMPFPYYRRRLCAFFDKTAEELGLPSDVDKEELVDEAPSPVARPSEPDFPVEDEADELPAVGRGSLSSGQDRNYENITSLANASQDASKKDCIMRENFRQYHLTKILSKKYSHTTYLASPTNQPERQVILIILTPSLFHLPRERENWLADVQPIKQVQHPHLLPILDMGIEQGQPFAVREYLPHDSLRDRLRKFSSHPLKLSEALTIISEVGQALTYAHESNIIHGNIKPENILFDAHDRALLTDFSLMTRKDASIRDQTAEEYAFCYTAPEQFSGTSDTRSDQYALGCLTYELITGQVPFAAQSLVSMLGYHNHSRPAPLSEKVTGLQPSLETAVLKAVAKDPAERFADCSLFLEIIRSVLPLTPVSSLGDPTHSREQSTRARLAQRKETHEQVSPIRRRAVRRLARQTVQRATSKHLEQLAVSSDVDVEKAVSEVATSNTSSSEWTGIIPPSEDLASHLQFTSSLSRETHHSDKRAYEQEALKPSHSDFLMKEDVLDAILDLNLEYKNNGYTEKETDLALTNSNDIHPPRSKQVLGNRRLLERAFFLLVITGLLVYAFGSLMMNTTPKTSLPVIKKKIPIASSIPAVSATVIPVPLIPAQTSQASATALPIVQPSVFPTHTPTVIVTPTPTPTPTPISYEAESSENTLTGSAQYFSCTGGCSGKGRIGCLGLGCNGTQGTLQFNNVRESSAGSYRMTIYYTEGDPGSRTGYISVNGGSAIAFTAPYTGSFDIPGSINTTISLNAGNNTIKFFNPQQSAPDIDRIVV